MEIAVDTFGQRARIYAMKKPQSNLKGRSAWQVAKLGLRAAMDKHAQARNYPNWCGRIDSGTARR